MRYATLSIFLLAWLVSGCGFPERPEIVTVSDPSEIRPAKPSDITTPEDAIAAIMTICRKDLQLSAPDRIQLFLYKNSASFASYGQGWSNLPIDVDNITAFTQREGKIHIDLGKTHGKSWGKLIDILAHEYGHAIQNSFSNRPTARWFTEGFASWIAAKVLDSLGWQDYAVALERAKIELINDYDQLKGLRDLDWQWQALSDKPNGHVETYILAFFATARLLDRQGFPRGMEYIKTGNFLKSFNMTQDTFATDFAVHLSAILPTEKTDTSVIQKPDWKLGDEWTYAVKYPGDEPVVTRRIVRDDKFDGHASYVIKAANRELFHSKETLERVAATKDGQLSSKRFSPSHQFSWPISLGKHWKNKYGWRDYATKADYKINHSIVVSEIGDVTVPAGTFLAARIQASDTETGRLSSEYWYSPTTKWIIKSRDYSDIAFREEELTSFKIN